MLPEELKNILSKQKIDRYDLENLLYLEEQGQIEELFNAANNCRLKYCGDEIHLRAVIDISNYCSQHCNYCKNREENFSLKRYRMQPEEIVETAKRIAKFGIGTVVLQSGEDLQFDTDIIAYIIYSIKQSTDIAISLSFGERGLDEYRVWKIAGADRYILKFETSNESKYTEYRNKKFLNDRVQHLKYLKRIGYQIGSGNLIGLPSQSIEDLVEDIFLLSELDVDMALFDTLIPVPFTPFQNLKRDKEELTLKTIAAARLILQNVHITSNLLEINFTNYDKALNCGANVIMPNFTPRSYLSGTSSVSEREMQIDAFENQKKLQKEIESLGFKVSYSKGHSLKKSSICKPH